MKAERAQHSQLHRMAVALGTAFEESVARALARFGATLSRIGGGFDGGVDLEGRWLGVRVVVQCKRQARQKVKSRCGARVDGASTAVALGRRRSPATALSACDQRASRVRGCAVARPRADAGPVCQSLGLHGRRAQQLSSADDSRRCVDRFEALAVAWTPC